MSKPVTLEELNKVDGQFIGFWRGMGLPDPKRVYATLKLALAVVEAARKATWFTQATHRLAALREVEVALAAFDRGGDE